MSYPKNILITRFSALGDVAMLAPVLKELLQQFPDVHITMVSKPFFEPIFNGIERLTFCKVNLEEYRGVFGLFRLAKELNKVSNFDAVIDAHNVLRTKALRLFLPTAHKKVSVIKKGRDEKKKLTRQHNKVLKPLKLMVERYADCFRAVGFDFELNNRLQKTYKPLTDKLIANFGNKKSNWIGIAPFAAHAAKKMPLEKAEHIIEQLADLPNVKIFLFGGGTKEKTQLKSIASLYRNVYNVVGRVSFEEELTLISHLDVMVSMDSANMHFASLVGVPVVSVWGGTHPYLGFLGYGQSITNAVQSELSCRPCSVYGNKPCFRGDYACLEEIKEDDVLIKVSKFLVIED